jgi:hypothetical protein
MGAPSRAQAKRFADAWAKVMQSGWTGAAPQSFRHGTLVVGVASASLRDRLARFEAESLLARLQALLPADRVIALRFVATADEPR